VFIRKRNNFNPPKKKKDLGMIILKKLKLNYAKIFKYLGIVNLVKM